MNTPKPKTKIDKLKSFIWGLCHDPGFGEYPPYREALRWLDEDIAKLSSSGADLKLEYCRNMFAEGEKSIRLNEEKLWRHFQIASCVLAAVLAYAEFTGGFTWWALPSVVCMILVMVVFAHGTKTLFQPNTSDPQGFVSFQLPDDDPSAYHLYLAASYATAAIGLRPINSWRARWHKVSRWLLTAGLILTLLIFVSQQGNPEKKTDCNNKSSQVDQP